MLNICLVVLYNQKQTQSIQRDKMNQLTVIANIKAKSDKVDFLKAELLKLIDKTREEEGCIDYVLHQDNKDPAQFVFYENWKSSELLTAHSNSQHVKDFQAATKDAIESFSLSELTILA